MEKMKVKVTFVEEILGTEAMDKEIHEKFIASKAPDAKSLTEEVEAVGVEGVVENAMTGFARNEDGVPILWDYQFRGFFKEACGMLRRVPDSKSAKVKAYKKVIDGTIFIGERKIPLVFEGKVGSCQRPLRGQTAQGERIALANSETVPAGATCEFTVLMLNGADKAVVKEWLDYGRLHGMGQWRNSGKGAFTWEEVK